MSWTPSTSSAKSLVDLQEWDDLLHRPEVVPAVSPVDLAVHRHLEQDRSHNPVAAKLGLVMMRLRISWMRSNISSSSAYWTSPSP
jgi:hypothetical protein